MNRPFFNPIDVHEVKTNGQYGPKQVDSGFGYKAKEVKKPEVKKQWDHDHLRRDHKRQQDKAKHDIRPLKSNLPSP